MLATSVDTWNALNLRLWKQIAAGEGQTEVCKSLLSEGADPLARDISDRSVS